MDEKVLKMMTLLDCDEATAKQVIADDERIDKGEKLFELTDEQKAVAKKYRQGDRKPTAYKFTKRERKADNAKRDLIEILAQALINEVDDLEKTNPERELNFKYCGRKFKVVLSAPRS